VIPFNALGPVPVSQPVINGHTGNVLDFDFNPFHDNIVASASEDTTVKVRYILSWCG
jgi:coronin-1B/1C/6